MQISSSIIKSVKTGNINVHTVFSFLTSEDEAFAPVSLSIMMTSSLDDVTIRLLSTTTSALIGATETSLSSEMPLITGFDDGLLPSSVREVI